MTWNVENLFDVGDEDGPDTQAELKAKIESLRSPPGRSRSQMSSELRAC